MCVHLHVSIAAGNGSFQFCPEPRTTLKGLAHHSFDTRDGSGAVVLSHPGSRADKITKSDSLYV